VTQTETPGHGLPATSRSLPIALIRAREAAMAPIRKMLAETGITEQQWRILRVLVEQGPLDSSRLAAHASLLLPSVTRILQSMRHRGLVQQTSDSEDRRRTIVTITAAGRQIIDDNADEAQRIVESYKAWLGPEKYEMLLDLLADLSRWDEPGDT
jgi:homoprotocatechuate degradation regulator HpaR